MISTTTTTTVQTPSRFALPACGHASFFAVRGTDFGFAGIRVQRERIAAVKGGMGLVTAYVPGTTAWSPPTS
jgi:hypothetical protein